MLLSANDTWYFILEDCSSSSFLSLFKISGGGVIEGNSVDLSSRLSFGIWALPLPGYVFLSELPVLRFHFHTSMK